MEEVTRTAQKRILSDSIAPQPRRSFRAVSFILFILVILFAGAAGYFYWKSGTVEPVEDAKNAVAVDDLVMEVGKLIVLPTDEKPTVATVTDVAKLKGQPFFEKARVGYKVLIYTNNKKAILYDPIGKIIVEVGALNLSK
jgi:hypothetical protein